MNNTAAYQVGQAIGLLIGVAVFVGIMALFVVCLVQAIKKRTAGWIVGTVLSALPVAFLVVVIALGFAKGFKHGLSIGLENAAIQNNQPSPLLKAPMSPVTGVVLPYQISLPNLPDWVKMQKMGAYDREYIFDNACMGVIAESVGTHNSQHTAELAIGLLKKRVPNATATEPTHVDIGSKFWATFDASATVQGMDFKYRYYVYGDDNNTYQIITWCNPQSFDHFAPVFDRIAQSFKMP